VFGLRMNRGVRPSAIAERFDAGDLAFLDPLWADLESAGLLQRKPPDRVALTLKGRLLADRIGVAVMEAFDGTGGPADF